MHEQIIILDFGSQYTQLIARRVREHNVYCEIQPFQKPIDLDDPNIKAVILSGSPCSVRQENYPNVNLRELFSKKPVLAICYGAQLVAQEFGGVVDASASREFGYAELECTTTHPIFKSIPKSSQVWMSHSDSVNKLPNEFEVIATTGHIPFAAYASKVGSFNNQVVAIQFHPEVVHTTHGSQLIHNFLFDIAQCKGEWTSESFIEEEIQRIRTKVGDEQVLLGLSGGVDSTVAASILHKAIGKHLHCFFIDNGLLRKDEYQTVLDSYKHMGLDVYGIDAQHTFISQLEGVSDPEEKRKIIGKCFIEAFEQEAKRFPEVKWLAQGTIYPDVIESVSVHGPSVTIKSHHNVGGLPERMHLKIIEPLRMLFKDEVRRIGATLEVPKNILNRHPFPGPGLAIRILGAISRDKIKLLQDADAIYIQNLKESGWYDKVWQAGAILLPVQSVGVMGDERTYEFTLALRSVNSNDGMTAEWSKLPYELLAKISNDIINKVKGINRVVYDISSKPPATIEWE